MTVTKTTMKELPVSEQPFEKCIEAGAEALSDKELLTVLIRSGNKSLRADEIALELLEMCGKEGISALTSFEVSDFDNVPGIGQVKAIQLSCVIELSRRIANTKKPWGNKFSSSEQIAEYYIPRLCGKTKEQLHVLVMDVKNRVIKDEIISIGNVNTSICDPREIMAFTLKMNGVNIILMHNHPSGDPSPSRDDIIITERVFKAGKLVGINLLDHIIIGRDSFVSLKGDGFYDFK